MMKLRILTLFALFQIVLGAGILAGGLFSSLDAHFYFSLFRMENPKGYASMEYKGEPEPGVILIQPGKKIPLPSIPVISIDKKSSGESFSSYPAQPMDWAVLFFRLRNMGASHIGVVSPMTWDSAPDDIVSEALSHELEAFKSSRIGKTLTLSARESLLPEQWNELALNKDQYVGDTKNIPAANKFYGEAPQLAKTISVVPSLVENDDVFTSPDGKKSMPLFVRWNQSLLPTLPLLVTLDAMNLTLKDVYVHFGGVLRLGDRIRVPIDESGRIPLQPGTGDDSIALSSILSSETSPRAVESAQQKEIVSASLRSSPAVLIAEAPMGSDAPEACAFHAARTIKNLFPSIIPAPPLELRAVSPWIQWVLLIDILVIGFWAFQFDGWVRRALLGFCIGIIPIVACYKWISSLEWLPLTPCIASIIALLLVKRFIPVFRKEEDADDLIPDKPEPSNPSLPSVSSPEHVFNEPDEVPIPGQKGKKHSS